MVDFEPLAIRLKNHYNSSLRDMPQDLAEQIQREFFGDLWNDLTPEQRRCAIKEREFQNNPKNRAEFELAFNKYVDIRSQLESINAKISQWEATLANTPSDLALKEDRLTSLYLDKETATAALESFGTTSSADDNNSETKVGSSAWRRKLAQYAANTRHDQVGGSRDKQQQIRDIWATGKYSTRDRCAEEECRGLDMSISTARKALINAPDPKPTD